MGIGEGITEHSCNSIDENTVRIGVCEEIRELLTAKVWLIHKEIVKRELAKSNHARSVEGFIAEHHSSGNSKLTIRTASNSVY